MRRCLALFFCSFILVFGVQPASAQSASARGVPGSIGRDLKAFVETPAVPGYESGLAAEIRSRLRAFSPKTDNLGDVLVTIGSGAPRRLLVAPMDEPGFVVSRITDDGYLQLQRLPQFAMLPLFNELYSAQPVEIQTASGKWINGVVAGLSVHLLPGRLHPPDMSDIENMYVDVGATSAGEARRIGADLLCPVVLDRTLYNLGDGMLAAPAIGDRFGDAALVDLLRHLNPAKLRGTLTVAFVAQQWAGARGLERVLDEVQPDELIYVGRLLPSGPLRGEPQMHRAPRRDPGSGVLVGEPDAGAALAGFAAEWKRLADQNQIPFLADYSAPLLPPSYLPAPKLPEHTVHLGIATAWPSTPAEMISAQDLIHLDNLLEAYLGAPQTPFTEMPFAPEKNVFSKQSKQAPAPSEALRLLSEAYGVSGHEGAVREEIKRLLPPWAKTETDSAGNLILHLAAPPAGAHPPRILMDAHMDEIGFEVREILPDGRLAVEWRGGGITSYYAGHAALVHTAAGTSVPAIMELPDGWDQPGFKWPRGRALMYRVDAGARSPQQVAQLGIKVGDFVTIPKKYRRLAGTRVNCRSFDDRMGDAALISAVWALGPNLKDRDVTFVWTTGEELGLDGAAAFAKELAAEGREPDYVFAVDTFVSSDSPLESKRFADAKVGDGFVVRAVDNSNLTPRKLTGRVLALARANHIPVQYGVTGGGNDGAAYLRYGAIDVALGWPLRYSHSPAELNDTRDLDALARIVAVLAQSW